MRMLAKLFHAEHVVDVPVEREWKVSKEGDQYRLSNGERSALVEANAMHEGRLLAIRDGLIYLGDKMLITPETHWVGFSARPARGKGKFFIDRPGASSVPVSVGGQVNALRAKLERGDHGFLTVGRRVVLESKKARELSLIVFDKVDGDGHLAYFNVLESGSKGDPVGTRGRLVCDAKGARFMEMGGDNAWYDTARFYDPSNGYAEAALRTLGDAERSAMFANDWRSLSEEAASLGVAVSDLEEHDELVRERDSLSESWSRQRFVVAEGFEWIRAQASGAQREPGA